MIRSLHSSFEELRWRRRPLLRLLGGAAGGQIAMAVSLPIVALLYSPSEIGTFALILAYGQFAAIVVTLRIEQMIPRLDVDEVWGASKITLVGASILSLPAALIVAQLSPSRSFASVLSIYGMISTTAAISVAVNVLLGQAAYARVASLRLWNGVGTGIAQVVGGLLLPSVSMLLATYALGNIVGLGFALRGFRIARKDRGPFGAWRLLLTRNMLRFGGTVSTGALLSNLGLTLPLTGVTLLFGESSAATYWLGRRLLMVPTQLLASTLSDFVYSLIARDEPETIATKIRTWQRKTVAPTIALIVCGIIGAPCADLMLGKDYAHVGLTILILTPGAAFQFAGTTFGKVLLALHAEMMQTLWHLGRLILLLAMYILARYASFDYLLSVASLSAFNVGTYSVLLALILLILRRKVVT